ncbi:Formyltransferase [Xylaria bambusicola]|uniref:Formyltransferase n=1 Tax=Xylaria bambusicola TaxID=326684 RepID=UPI002008A182|nr:Formyltransferase [Xylaria bambusicola]KAI0521759.1 Formyltransferase [Xylaria bambusicola]
MKYLSSLLGVAAMRARLLHLYRSSQYTNSHPIKPRSFSQVPHYNKPKQEPSVPKGPPVPKEPSDPLHILFCGSDEFSCSSLKALYHEHIENPDLIQSIEVVVRPGKRTGRGLQKIQDPPIRSVADTLNLKIHTRDTFTGWDMPTKTNLIIAVSFGLFVPPRLLRAAKYGGLNLHPSLLPDLRGPAPLHHALLNNYTITGVSLQTLDHNAFDHGVVLAQTPRGRKNKDTIFISRHVQNPSYLQSLITPAATRLLINGLRENVHVPPHVRKGWVPPRTHPIRHAPKITKQDRQLTRALLQTYNFWGPPTPKMLVSSPLTRRQAAIGPLWFLSRDRSGEQKRIIIEAVDDHYPESSSQEEDYTPRPRFKGDQHTHSFTLDCEDEEDNDIYTIEEEDKDVPSKDVPSRDVPTMLAPASAKPGPLEFAIPFEDEPEDDSQQRSETQHDQRMNLTFWAPEIESDDLYLGKNRIVSLKVEGDKARPARHALHAFVVNTEDWRAYTSRRDYLDAQKKKDEKEKET